MARHGAHGAFDYPHEDIWCEEYRPPHQRLPLLPIPDERSWPAVERKVRTIINEFPDE